MTFIKRLRECIRRERIRCSVRVWTRPHVKVGGRYRMDEGHVVVDSISPIALADVTYDLARESGFQSVDELLQTAKHGSGDNVYLIRFHYLPPGGWDTPTSSHRRKVRPCERQLNANAANPRWTPKLSLLLSRSPFPALWVLRPRRRPRN